MALAIYLKSELRKFAFWTTTTPITGVPKQLEQYGQQQNGQILSATIEAKHILSVPCDSHGLQLISKDLLWPGIDRDRNQIDTAIGKFFHNGPNKIVSYFTSSPKQLSYLREILATTTGGVKALITNVPTRWETQFLQTKSINRSFEALKIYAENPDDVNEPIVNLKASHLHRSCDFWQQNKEFERFLERLHNLQKMNESNKTKLDKVYTRWATAEAHLREWSIPGTSSWSEDITSYYHRIGKNSWQARKAQQVLPIHYVAYELNPQNWSKLTDPTEHEIIDNFILERGGVVGFDQLFQPSAYALFTIALELNATTANSVPSERAFSTMNLLQNKIRNRLTTEKMNMPCFIYINSRSLRAHKEILTEERVLIDQQIEDYLLNQEDEIFNNVVDHEEENWEDPYGLDSFDSGVMGADLDNLTTPELEII
ncbi:hypothetical protein GcC1_075008 [Golovinomyces cichoracearum]|uniref:HAT C-terminal dimerisation domain-containing protein n=1 Tax=Golovinomyces cichoracearum TaxID=62708 RepID=A0A420IN54_9PEZI|nr:hypothetical protein GcC1_075008 [Golovinomyces cichoracearum]